MGSKNTIRIGNAGGYWGDDPQALYRQVHGGDLDYITMDFLAEVTMSIMQKQRHRDPNLGYAKDFIGMLKGVMETALAKKTCIITNAGGVNPPACAAAIAKLAESMGLKPKIAVVYGDDILSKLKEYQSQELKFSNMETGRPFSDIDGRVESANVYFGAGPVVKALEWKPDIVVTGRVTDTGITLGAMMHEFGWAPTDWNKLAAGIVAGHIIECGCQVTGGNFTDWQKVRSFKDIGYPIVEVNRDGTFVVTKHPGSGGQVSVDTVREQLFYEMGDPRGYITPDVVADFTSIKLKADGEDRVHVSGVCGFAPTPLYKVSMAYRDGFKSTGSIAISGPRAREKAQCFARIFWDKCGQDFLATETEYFGWNACHRSLGGQDDGNEILLRLSARSEKEESLQRFGKLVPSLILSGPPGVAVLGGVPKPAEVVSYWPTLMPKKDVQPLVALWRDGLVEEIRLDNCPEGNFEGKIDGFVQIAAKADRDIITELASNKSEVAVLETICLGRSGDKGDTANIGILARSPEAYDFLKGYLTAQKVKNLFQELCDGRVIRFEVPNMQGFNFLLENSLGGGGTLTLRTDAQGKTFAQALLRQHAAIPQSVLKSCQK